LIRQYSYDKEISQKLYDRLESIFDKTKDCFILEKGIITFFENEEGRSLHTWEETKELQEFMKRSMADYDKSCQPYTIVTMWANKYPNGSFIKKHKHVVYENTISAVFYLKTPENSGKLFIQGEELVEITPIEKNLVLFPSYLEHWTSPNESNECRVLIGADICYDNLLHTKKEVPTGEPPKGY
jgi:hypothetical protein